jgi:hypothetical protein
MPSSRKKGARSGAARRQAPLDRGAQGLADEYAVEVLASQETLAKLAEEGKERSLQPRNARTRMRTIPAWLPSP